MRKFKIAFTVPESNVSKITALLVREVGGFNITEIVEPPSVIMQSRLDGAVVTAKKSLNGHKASQKKGSTTTMNARCVKLTMEYIKGLPPAFQFRNEAVRQLLVRQGYSKGTASSILTLLKDNGIVKSVERGLYTANQLPQ